MIEQNYSCTFKWNLEIIYIYIIFISAGRNFRKKIRMGWIEPTFARHAITTHRWRLFAMGALGNDRLRRRPLGMSGDI